jgi:hypothetical protein
MSVMMQISFLYDKREVWYEISCIQILIVIIYNTFTNTQLDSFLPSLMLCCQLV